ncbi:hypothetical protein ALC57_01665, partial [Trachymyrmex cornetzi]
NEIIEQSNPEKVLQYLISEKLELVFPNLVIALRILLTLPVSVASGERFFSKLKLIKNDLRNIMGQDKLSDLALILIEFPLCNSLDINDIINNFANLKARRVNI